MNEPTMKGKICLITGANTGIGRATAEGLARMGATVVLLCRSHERGEEARVDIATRTGNPAVELLVADLSSTRDVRRAAAEFSMRHAQLDVLINNAGVFLPSREVTDEGVEKTLATNYVGHFLLTHLLLPALRAAAPSRVINVASRVGGAFDFKDPTLTRRYSTNKAVSQSKRAQIMFTQDLAESLGGSGITVNAIHPGIVKTALLDDMPWLMRKVFHLLSISAETSARGVIHLASGSDVVSTSGKFFAGQKELRIPPALQDRAARAQLWTLSERLSGMSARERASGAFRAAA
jgi:NAD(P)-dependent dehydrogenase (short-subunit alcohol dehydrogenase family)